MKCEMYSYSLFIIFYVLSCFRAETLAPSLPPSSAPSAFVPSRSSLNNIRTIMGNGTAGSSRTTFSATATLINRPTSVWKDSLGFVFVSEFDGNVIRKFHYTTNIVEIVAGGNGYGCSASGSVATSAVLGKVSGVSANTLGEIFFTDWYCLRVRYVSSGVLLTLLGIGSAIDSGDDGPSTSAAIHYPRSVWPNTVGVVYVSSNYGHHIRRVDVSGIVTSIAGTGHSGFSGDGGPATSATINFVDQIYCDSIGTLYFADVSNRRIRSILESGIVATIAGGGSTSEFGIASTSITIGDPSAVFVDANGDMYFGGYYTRRILVTTKVSGLVSAFAGNGIDSVLSTANNGDDGAATSASFLFADQIFLDTSSRMLVADNGNHRIREVFSVSPTVSPTLIPSTSPSSLPPTRAPSYSFAPSVGRGSQYFIDTALGNGTLPTFGSSYGIGGLATAARVYMYYVWGDSNGYIYASVRHYIWKFSIIDQIVINVAGMGYCGSGVDNIAATASTFCYPIGLFVDTVGKAYVGDHLNFRVRQISTSSNIISTLAGTGGVDIGASGPGTSIGIQFPFGVWADSGGQVYFVNSIANSASNLWGSTVRILSVSGYCTTLAGKCVCFSYQ